MLWDSPLCTNNMMEMFNKIDFFNINLVRGAVA